jgi:hypothetical protein
MRVIVLMCVLGVCVSCGGTGSRENRRIDSLELRLDQLERRVDSLGIPRMMPVPDQPAGAAPPRP